MPRRSCNNKKYGAELELSAVLDNKKAKISAFVFFNYLKVAYMVKFKADL